MMEHIAFFPNASSASNSAPADMLGNLASLGGEAGDGVSFEALISAQASAETPVPASQSPLQAAAQTGSFEDVSVILQLLRVAQNEAAPQGSANIALPMLPESAPDAADGDASLPIPPQLPTAQKAEVTPSPAPHPLLLAQMQAQHTIKADAAMTSANKPEAEASPNISETETPEPMLIVEDDPAALVLAHQNMPAQTPATPAASALAFAAAQLQADSAPAPTGDAETELLRSLTASAAPENGVKAASAGPSTAMAPLQKLTGQDLSAPANPASELGSRSASLPREVIASASPLPAPTTGTAALDSNSALTMLLSNSAPVASESVQQVKQSIVDFGERLLEIGNDDAWIDQLAKDIAATKSSSGNISFRLMPANLGRIDVAMLQNDQGVSVHVDTQNETAASLVAASQIRLVEELRQQGVRVNHTEVTHTANEAGRHAGQEQGRGQHSAAAPFIETAPEFFSDGNGEQKGDAQPKGRYA